MVAIAAYSTLNFPHHQNNDNNRTRQKAKQFSFNFHHFVNTMALNQTSNENSKPSEKLPTRVASRDSKSVYDRLYKASTVSSKSRKEVAPVVPKNVLMRENEDPVPKGNSQKSRSIPKDHPKKPATSSTSNGAVFNRLYEKGTASSVSKRSKVDTNVTSSARAPMRPKNHF